MFKKNDNFHLYIDYQDLNKMTVKNHHFLSLINEMFNRLNKVKRFIKLNLKDIYHHFRIKKNDE